MPWQVFILLSIPFYSVATLLQRILLKEDKSDPVAYTVFFLIMVTAVYLVFGFLTKQIAYTDPRPFFLNFLLTSFLYGIGTVLLFKGLKSIEASEYTIVYASRILFTIISSSLIIHEGLKGLQIFGVVLILAAILAIFLRRKKFEFKKGHLFILLGSMCFGLEVVNDRIILHSFDVYLFLFFATLGPAIMILILYPKTIFKLGSFLKKSFLIRQGFISLIYGLGAISYFYALKTTTSSSLVASLNQLQTVLTVLLAMIFLHETKHTGRKILGAILSFIGAVILIK